MASSSPRSKRWILPLVVVLLWLFVGGPLGSFAGRLAEVQENDNAAFLPQSAESTLVLDEFMEFTGDETLPATVVFERDGRPDPAGPGDDRAVRRGARAGGVRRHRGGRSDRSPPRTAAPPRWSCPSPPSDGDADLEAPSTTMRDVLADPPDGLTALVGGQGGILGDFIEAFGAIDGILLLVALLVVLLILLVVYRTPVLPLVVLLSAVLALGVASAVDLRAGHATTCSTSTARARASCSSSRSAPRRTTRC